MKKTPIQRVERHLDSLGYVVLGDITFVHGGKHKVFNDIIECWTAHVRDPKNPANELEIKSTHTLTECQKGIRLVPNSENTCLYGDLIAEPFTRESEIAYLKGLISRKDDALRHAKQALTWSRPIDGHSCQGAVSYRQAADWHEIANEKIDAAL